MYTSTYQLASNEEQLVEALNAVSVVLPLAIDHYTRLLIQHPRKVMVVVAVIYRVGRRCGRRLGRCILVQLVSIVA